jgi:hypothetical protein
MHNDVGGRHRRSRYGRPNEGWRNQLTTEPQNRPRHGRPKPGRPLTGVGREQRRRPDVRPGRRLADPATGHDPMLGRRTGVPGGSPGGRGAGGFCRRRRGRDGRHGRVQPRPGARRRGSGRMRVDQGTVGNGVLRRMVADRGDRESGYQSEGDGDDRDLGGTSPPVQPMPPRRVSRWWRAMSWPAMERRPMSRCRCVLSVGHQRSSVRSARPGELARSRRVATKSGTGRDTEGRTGHGESMGPTARAIKWTGEPVFARRRTNGRVPSGSEFANDRCTRCETSPKVRRTDAIMVPVPAAARRYLSTAG